MSDLVERLRERADYEGYPGAMLIIEAADEIERLQARCAELERDAKRLRDARDSLAHIRAVAALHVEAIDAAMEAKP